MTARTMVKGISGMRAWGSGVRFLDTPTAAHCTENPEAKSLLVCWRNLLEPVRQKQTPKPHTLSPKPLNPEILDGTVVELQLTPVVEGSVD